MNALARVTIAVLFISTLSVAAIPSDPPFDNKLVTVTCDAGTSVTVGWTDASGNPAQDTWVDGNSNGKVEFAVPDYVTEVQITKLSDGRILQYTAKVGASSGSAVVVRN